MRYLKQRKQKMQNKKKKVNNLRILDIKGG